MRAQKNNYIYKNLKKKINEGDKMVWRDGGRKYLHPTTAKTAGVPPPRFPDHELLQEVLPQLLQPISWKRPSLPFLDQGFLYPTPRVQPAVCELELSSMPSDGGPRKNLPEHRRKAITPQGRDVEDPLVGGDIEVGVGILSV